MPIRRAYLNLVPVSADACHKTILAHNDKSPSCHDLPQVAVLLYEVNVMKIIPIFVSQIDPTCIE